MFDQAAGVGRLRRLCARSWHQSPCRPPHMPTPVHATRQEFGLAPVQMLPFRQRHLQRLQRSQPLR